MSNFCEKRKELFLEKTGEAILGVSEFMENPEEIQHEQMKTLAKVCLQLAPDLNVSTRDESEIDFSEGENNKNTEGFSYYEVMCSQAKSEEIVVATFNCEKDSTTGQWSNTDRFCQPSFRDRGIMKKLLQQTEEKVGNKGGVTLGFEAAGVQSVCWALAQGFKVVRSGQREKVYEYLKENGWTGESARKESLELLVIMEKELD